MFFYTRELLFDQMKAVVVEERRPEGGKLLENPEFFRFATHRGFGIPSLQALRPQDQEQNERLLRDVRGIFVYGREFTGDAHLDDQQFRRAIAESPGPRPPRCLVRWNLSTTSSPDSMAARSSRRQHSKH